MEIHGCIAGVVGVGIGVVGNEGVLLAGLGRAGFWGWTPFCYMVLLAWVLLFQLLYLAVGLSKIISKCLDWGKKIPNRDEEEHDSEEGRNLHVEQVKVLVQVMKLFVKRTV